MENSIFRRIFNIFNSRQLLFHLSLRDLKIRYKHPLLGFLWMILVPLCMAIIFKIVFSVIVRIPIPGYPFFIFLMTGVFPWSYLSSTLFGTTTSLVDNSNFIKKVYFPREVIPLSILISNFISFILMLVITLIFLVISNVEISKFIIFLPVVIFFQTIFMIGIILISSSLQVIYRDIKYLVEIVLLFWFYLTPIFYPLTLVREVSSGFFNFYMLNPLVGLITFYRITLLQNFTDTLPPGLNLFYIMLYTIFISLAVFILGMIVFSKNDKKLSDFV